MLKFLFPTIAAIKTCAAPASGRSDLRIGVSSVLYALFAAVLINLIWAGLAHAQTEPKNVDEIMAAAKGSGDAASGFFRHIVGGFWDNPWSMVGSAGSSAGLFGPMFAIYNAAIFIVGVAWMTYGLGSGIVETAHSGKALGQRMSPVWMPIRMVSGIAGIMPVFGGFSLSQVILVLAATVGIGMANMITKTAVEATDKFNAVITPSVAASAGDRVNWEKMANDMFALHACYLHEKDIDGINEKVGTDAINPIDVVEFGEKAISDKPKYYYGISIDRLGVGKHCGQFYVSYENMARSSSSEFGFRVASVNYNGFSSALREASVKSIYTSTEGLWKSIQPLAAKWYKNKESKTPDPYPSSEIEALAQSAALKRAALIDKAVSEATAKLSGSSGALNAGVKEEMTKYGFAGIGAWYSTFAEVGTALGYAANIGMAASDVAITDDLAKSIASARSLVNPNSVASAKDQDITAWAIEKAIYKIFGTPTGNLSLGQTIVEKSIYGLSAGSGGPGGLINPVTSAKNLGDYLLTAASTLIIAQGAASTADKWLNPVSENNNFLQKGAAFVLGVASGGSTVAAGVAAGATDGILTKLMFLLPYLMILGLLMSIYIPLIPFITWMGGLIQYVIIFCQGMVGMPIAAFAHLDTEGEGLGRRTEAGYMFLLNMAFRPALMVFGFFFASGLLIVIGSFQAQLFLTAMASAQGNSITGLLSILGYLFVFAVINFSLVQTLFNMIFLLPDQILSMVGGSNIGTDLGKDTEGKVHGLFIQSSRATTGIGAAGAASKAARDKKRADLAAAGRDKPAGDGSNNG